MKEGGLGSEDIDPRIGLEVMKSDEIISRNVPNMTVGSRLSASVRLNSEDFHFGLPLTRTPAWPMGSIPTVRPFFSWT
jgi:hypothetical protein